MSALPKTARVWAAAIVLTLSALAGVVSSLTWQLRAQLRAQILRREAESIYAVAQLQLRGVRDEWSRLGSAPAMSDWFAAVLESSRMRGVLAVQLFDRAGALQAALPQVGGELPALLPAGLHPPTGRFEADGALEKIYGLTAPLEASRTAVPLLEIIVPLTLEEPDHGALGAARYWLDGTAVHAEFGRMDRALVWQAALAFFSAAALVGLVLLWAARRVASAHRRLLAQSADLARANQELDFAARTGAIGAISAHLIHGLNNPLSGLEGFVSEQAVPGGEQGEAWRAAVETTRRLRSIVNEAVTVLREEGGTSGAYSIPVRELAESARANADEAALRAGVALHFCITDNGELEGRTANLSRLVLANLLANAIEASPAGSTVTLKAGLADGAVEFLVRDEGAGVPHEIEAGLFRPLRSTKAGGGGIGLAISRQLARHAGGELDLARNGQQGSTFRLRVPLAVASPGGATL
ncbi:MAG: hypothetical protein RIQ93_1544 [Verrucomicrobiota bacterium]|jgi:signal transduction histidine kinase